MSGSVRYRIRHSTVYDYRNDVVHSHQLLHLVPRPAAYQQCLEHVINVTPAFYRRRDDTDVFGNLVARVEFDRPHRRFEVATDMDVEVHPRPAVHAADSIPWERAAAELNYRGDSPARAHLEACRFRHESPHVRIKRLFAEYAAECFASGRPVLECAADLMRKLYRDLRYAPGETTIATPATEVLKTRRGVCQDFSHLMIACLRTRGLAARYVSGYVRQLTSDAEALVGSGASHAWVSVYAPPFGWFDLDPTNDTFVGTDHIAVAWGRDFGDVSPLRGIILGGGSHRLTVSVKVERLSRTTPS
jgi:transglutaminase-like putative cysteine protease